LASGARLLVEHAKRRGVRERALLARMGIDRDRLVDPDARLPASVYYTTIEAAAELTGDPLFALDALAHVSPENIGAVGFLAFSSATLGEALERIIRFHRVLTEADRFVMKLERGRAVFHVETWGKRREAHQQVAEMYAYDCIVMAARMTGSPIEVLDLRFRHQARASIDRYREIFGATPRFSSARDTWAIPKNVLDRAMPRADDSLVRYFEREAGRALEALPASTDPIDALRAYIARTLSDGEPSLAGAARELRISARSLQRRLEDRDTHFRDLIDDVRREHALSWLARGSSIAEVSFLLGYSEPRALHRAFRRWTGTTPQAWRARS
jgi:AraC-like DNA-binding protein